MSVQESCLAGCLAGIPQAVFFPLLVVAVLCGSFLAAACAGVVHIVGADCFLHAGDAARILAAAACAAVLHPVAVAACAGVLRLAGVAVHRQCGVAVLAHSGCGPG